MFYKPPPKVNPDEEMAGTCQSCKTSVACLRKDTEVRGGHWVGCPAVECPACRAVLHVMPLPPKESPP